MRKKRGRPNQNLKVVTFKVEQTTALEIDTLSKELKISKGKVVDLSINRLKNILA